MTFTVKYYIREIMVGLENREHTNKQIYTTLPHYREKDRK